MTATINARGLDLLTQWEGLRLDAYKCPAGKWTIGYGHTGERVKPGLRITAEQARKALEVDLARFARCVDREAGPATANQRAAMICLAYNIGERAFARSRVCALHRAQQYADAANAFRAWHYINRTPSKGLLARREAERKLYLRPDDLPQPAHA